jgi:uncharacterized protein (TIGR03435 family)
MTPLLNSLASVMATWGPSLVVKATVTLVLTLLVVRLAGQSRAAVRHLWLTAGFVVLLALPIAPALIPSVRVEVLPASSLFGEYIAEPLASEAPPAATVASSQHSVPPSTPRWTFVEVLTALWLAGVLVFAMPVVAGVVQVRRFRRNGLPWLDGQRAVSALAREAGLHRSVDVGLHESIGAPATCGIVRHTILFPIDARGWPNEDIARAAVHEVEHVRRADCLVNAFARVMCAVYWFHPLAWVAWRRLELEAERACDDAVLRRAEATTYADQLVTLAGRLCANTRHPLLAMANRSDLVQRVSAVLNPRQARGQASLTVAGGIVLAACALIVSISPLQAVSRASRTTQVPVSPDDSVDPTLQFEVASIRRPDPGGGVVMMRALPGRFEAINVLVRELLRQALRMPEEQIVGAPGWVNTERYTVNAKAPDGTPPTAAPVMLTNLLKDRFKLVTHTETRDLPVFHLVFARSDRRFGSNLKESSAECQAMIASRVDEPGAGDARPALPGTPGGPPLFDPVNPPCGSGRSGPGILGGGGYSISSIVQKLSEFTRRPVIDQTGLSGLYDFTLRFASEPGTYRTPGGMPLPPIPPSAADPDAPSLNTALQEQLGLKLEDQRGPVEVVVIDQLEKPTVD